MTLHKTLTCTAAIVCFSAISAGAATISTLAGESSTIRSWGLPNSAAYGQTFTLGTPATLNEVTFRINDGGTIIDFIAYLFAWDGSMPTGNALYSEVGSTSGTAAMTSVSASLGNVAVAAGQYVSFFQATSPGPAGWGSSPDTAYDGGAFVFQNNGGDESQFTASSWNTDWQGLGSDLAFEVTYDDAAPIPLPAALPMLAGGLGMLAVARRATRKS